MGSHRIVPPPVWPTICEVDAMKSKPTQQSRILGPIRRPWIFGILFVFGLLPGTCGCQGVWPLPSSFTLGKGTLGVAESGLEVTYTIGDSETSSDRLEAGIKRYKPLLVPNDSVSNPIHGKGLTSLDEVRMIIGSGDENLTFGIKREGYRIDVQEGTTFVNVTADSIYGALYAMETIVQLLLANNGTLPEVTI